MPRFLQIRRLFWRLAAMLLLCPAPAGAATGYYALDHAAIAVKDPAHTPLIAIARAGGALVAAGLHGTIVVSTDNGQSWTQAKVPVDLTLTDLYFTSPRDGWAVGHYGTILHSTDGGRSWRVAVSGLEVIQAVSATAASAASAAPAPGAPWVASAATDQRVASAYTQDGPSKPFLAVGMCGGALLAAGQQDMAMRRQGQGNWAEWTSKINNPDFQNIYDIVPDGASTLLVGENGLLLRGDSSCRNFTPLSGPYTATLFGAVQAGGQWVVFGLQGEVYRSADEGASWAPVTLGTDAAILAGVALPSGRVLLAAGNGNLYLSAPDLSTYALLPQHVPAVADLARAADGGAVAVGALGVSLIPATSLR